MQWHTVVFNRGDQRGKDTATQACMHSFVNRYREFLGPTPGRLTGVEIQHTKDECDNHLYHVSPMAASIGAPVLHAGGSSGVR